MIGSIGAAGGDHKTSLNLCKYRIFNSLNNQVPTKVPTFLVHRLYAFNSPTTFQGAFVLAHLHNNFKRLQIPPFSNFCLVRPHRTPPLILSWYHPPTFVYCFAQTMGSF